MWRVVAQIEEQHIAEGKDGALGGSCARLGALTVEVPRFILVHKAVPLIVLDNWVKFGAQVTWGQGWVL